MPVEVFLRWLAEKKPPIEVITGPLSFCRGHNNNSNNNNNQPKKGQGHDNNNNNKKKQKNTTITTTPPTSPPTTTTTKKKTRQKRLLLVRFRCTSARFSSSSHIFIHLCSAFQPVYLLLSISEKSKRTNIYMHFAYIYMYIHINKFSIVCLKKLNCFYCHEKKLPKHPVKSWSCFPANPTRSSLVAAANGPQQYRSSWAPTEIQHR